MNEGFNAHSKVLTYVIVHALSNIAYHPKYVLRCSRCLLIAYYHSETLYITHLLSKYSHSAGSIH